MCLLNYLLALLTYLLILVYKCDDDDAKRRFVVFNCGIVVEFFTGRQRSCKPCNSYRRKAVRPSVCLSVCLSVTRWH